MGQTLSWEKIQRWNKLYYKVVIVLFIIMKIENNPSADQQGDGYWCTCILTKPLKYVSTLATRKSSPNIMLNKEKGAYKIIWTIRLQLYKIRIMKRLNGSVLKQQQCAFIFSISQFVFCNILH